MIDRLYIIGMIAFVCAGTLGLLWMQSAAAQTAPASVPAYEGCALAWDYPAAQASLVESIGVHVEGKTGSLALGAAARSVPCKAIVDRFTLPFGEHIWKVRVFNKALGHSPFAEIKVNYQAKPTLVSPTGIKITMELEAAP